MAEKTGLQQTLTEKCCLRWFFAVGVFSEHRLNTFGVFADPNLALTGMMVTMANYSRQPRDELVRQLREQGWSFRRIAAHPKVMLSVGAVHAIVHRDDVEDDDLDDEPEPEPSEPPPGSHAAQLAKMMGELYLEDGTPNKLTLYRLEACGGSRFYSLMSDEQRAAVDGAWKATKPTR